MGDRAMKSHLKLEALTCTLGVAVTWNMRSSRIDCVVGFHTECDDLFAQHRVHRF